MTIRTSDSEGLRSFAYFGPDSGPAYARLADAAAGWPFKNAPPRIRPFSPRAPLESDWRDPAVGWGLILADAPGLSARERARADDAPEPIRELLRRREGATVLRYRADSPARGRLLWDATSEVDASIASSPLGVSAGCLPKYLLIYAAPSKVPWSIQYALNVTRCVGRLDLEGEALENYVSALLSDWVHVSPPNNTAIVWATSHGSYDATARGRDLVAEPFVARLKENERFTGDVVFLDGDERATSGRLVQALVSERPSTVVTSSNGNFAGFENDDADRSTVGAPVDQDGELVTWDEVLARWDPAGAVWYANASYSAGVDDDPVFEGLVDEESPLGRSLSRRTRIPAMSAPFARALLGAKKPLRAFVGHVGPLFQTSLEASADVRSLTSTLVDTVVETMIRNEPIAATFAAEWFDTIAPSYAKFDEHLAGFNANRVPAATLIRDLLTVFNIERTAILGDPTVVAQPGSRQVVA